MVTISKRKKIEEKKTGRKMPVNYMFFDFASTKKKNHSRKNVETNIPPIFRTSRLKQSREKKKLWQKKKKEQCH